MLRLLVALLLSVSLCLPAFADEPTPIESMTLNGPQIDPEFNREQRLLIVQVVVHEDVEALNKFMEELAGEKIAATFLGYTVWGDKDMTCQIHIIKAKFYNDPQFAVWGHELGHCLYGGWHNELSAADLANSTQPQQSPPQSE